MAPAISKRNGRGYSLGLSFLKFAARIKSIKGTSGMIKYIQIETFHPLTESSELEKLKKLNVYKINEKLELFN